MRHNRKLTPLRLFILFPALLLGALVPAAVSFSGDSVPGAARYELKPSAAGFVRLDTVSGAVSHCVPDVEGWSCAALDTPDGEERLMAVSEDVEKLAAALRDLTVRVDQIAEGMKAQEAEEVAAEVAPPPLATFVSIALDRFLTMVRILKYGNPAAA